MSAQMASPSGIPKVPFEEDPALLVHPGKSTEETIMAYRDLLNKLKFIEANLMERLTRSEAKRAELRSNINVVDLLLEAGKAGTGPLPVDFELGDGLLARGEVDPDNAKVHLWLSAGTMLAYPPAEAKAMLEQRVIEAEDLVKSVESELRFVKEQLTTAEVNQARLINYIS